MQTLLKLKQSTLSLNDALVLGFICLHPDCRQKDIQAAVKLNPTVISQTVKKFVQRRLVTEAPLKLAQSARNWAKVYKATAEGRKLAGPFTYPDIFGDVTAFSEKFGLPLNKPQVYEDASEREALLKHLREELKEFQDALKAGNRADQFDALVDGVYLMARYCAALGFQFDEGWRRVQAANMAKIKVRSADDSKRGTKYDVKKPEGWKAPDLADLV